jgi:hypothetical protein
MNVEPCLDFGADFVNPELDVERLTLSHIDSYRDHMEKIWREGTAGALTRRTYVRGQFFASAEINVSWSKYCQ